MRFIITAWHFQGPSFTFNFAVITAQSQWFVRGIFFLIKAVADCSQDLLVFSVVVNSLVIAIPHLLETTYITFLTQHFNYVLVSVASLQCS